jgi:hypothetical protein
MRRHACRREQPVPRNKAARSHDGSVRSIIHSNVDDTDIGIHSIQVIRKVLVRVVICDDMSLLPLQQVC